MTLATISRNRFTDTRIRHSPALVLMNCNTPLSEAAVWSLPLWGRGGIDKVPLCKVIMGEDLITRAEKVLAVAKEEKRELTPEEAQELKEIKAKVDMIAETIKLDRCV